MHLTEGNFKITIFEKGVCVKNTYTMEKFVQEANTEEQKNALRKLTDMIMEGNYDVECLTDDEFDEIELIVKDGEKIFRTVIEGWENTEVQIMRRMIKQMRDQLECMDKKLNNLEWAPMFLVMVIVFVTMVQTALLMIPHVRPLNF